MKTIRTACQLLFLLFSLLITGCATTSNYCENRLKDAVDIVTVTVGNGGGFKVRGGPVTGGIFMGFDEVGFRGRHAFVKRNSSSEDLILGGIPFFAYMGIPLDHEQFNDYQVEENQFLAYVVLPFVSILSNDYHSKRIKARYFSQAEIALGLRYTFRFGLNVAEMADFFMGLINIDFMEDDPWEIWFKTKERGQSVMKEEGVKEGVSPMN